jgi:hypothetical protein
MDRHGIRLVREHPELEFAIDRPVGEEEIRQLLRAGLDAAEASGLLTRRYKEAAVQWLDRDGEERQPWVSRPSAGRSFFAQRAAPLRGCA